MHSVIVNRPRTLGWWIAVAGGTAVGFRLSVWPFIMAGDFVGAITRGWLAIPAAVCAAALTVIAGAWMGGFVYLLVIQMIRRLRHRDSSSRSNI